MSNSNARYFIWSNGLQNLGDQIVASKTVLPALFNAAGVPAFFTGLLTPIRESGSMLPQAALTPWVTTHRARKRLWMIGSTGQAISGAVIALAAFFIRGAWLGVVVLLALAALSLFRALCSIAGKDVQARTISKGQRGRVTGSAAALGGGATLLAGVILFLLGDLTISTMGIVLLVGASTWAIATWVFSHVEEPVPEGSKRASIRAGGQIPGSFLLAMPNSATSSSFALCCWSRRFLPHLSCCCTMTFPVSTASCLPPVWLRS